MPKLSVAAYNDPLGRKSKGLLLTLSFLPLVF